MADKASYLYRRIGFPGYSRMIKAIVNGCILNCPITVDDVKRAIHIYGPDIIALKGRNTRRKPEQIGMLGNIPLPPNVLRHH